jgi:FSR family fosmidomycin resistance protein-like MFS transporter
MSLEETQAASPATPLPTRVSETVFAVIGALSLCHLINDLIQSLVPAIYPVLKATFGLNFSQVGEITLVQQLTASLLQPCVGHFTDRHPRPYSLVVGMGFTLTGLIMIAVAPSFPLLLIATGVVGIGSSIFHPESSRMARAASGGRHGLAQSLFQVGGNAGSSFGPLLAALIVVPHGRHSLAAFAATALVSIPLLLLVGGWFKSHPAARKQSPDAAGATKSPVSSGRVASSIAILMALIFSKYFYLTSITTYFTFYLMHKFHVGVQDAQVHLFVFLGAVALGTVLGGPIGDRIGRKYVIWASILGVLPFTLALPHAGLVETGILSAVIGFVLASAFSAILVYAQELLPSRVGLVSGLFFGFAFGMGGIGAAVLGHWADISGIELVYRVCSFLPAIGLLAAFLPNLDQRRGRVS